MNAKFHRFLPLTLTIFLSAWQIAKDHPGDTQVAVWAYTVGFGILLVASLWLILMGLEVLGNPVGVVIAALIPLSFSFGLVAEYAPVYTWAYLGFALIGLLGIAATRFMHVSTSLRVWVVAFVHGMAGFSIISLPLLVLWQGQAGIAVLGVSVGGVVVGISGMALLWQRMGASPGGMGDLTPLLPWAIWFSTICLVIGFNLR
jgi:hypothetical protein